VRSDQRTQLCVRAGAGCLFYVLWLGGIFYGVGGSTGEKKLLAFDRGIACTLAGLDRDSGLIVARCCARMLREPQERGVKCNDRGHDTCSGRLNLASAASRFNLTMFLGRAANAGAFMQTHCTREQLKTPANGRSITRYFLRACGHCGFLAHAHADQYQIFGAISLEAARRILYIKGHLEDDRESG